MNLSPNSNNQPVPLYMTANIKETDCPVLGKKQKAAVGFEPTNNGFANRRHKNTSIDKIKTCKNTKGPLTPQLTPKYQKQPKIDTTTLSAELTEIVAAWPNLPGYIKVAIKALIKTT